jgi:hypothetical protein
MGMAIMFVTTMVVVRLMHVSRLCQKNACHILYEVKLFEVLVQLEKHCEKT